MTRLVMRTFLFGILLTYSASAQGRFIVRVSGGLLSIHAVCGLLNCTIGNSLDGNRGQLFLVTNTATSDPNSFLRVLVSQTGVVSAEMDVLAKAADSSSSGTPSALRDNMPVQYYGATVIQGYIKQPATSLVSLYQAQSTLGTSGWGIVAVIDTGADSNHPVLKNVLLPGYDFTRNTPGSDEAIDVTLNSVPSLENAAPVWTNSQSNAVVDQSTAAVIDGNGVYSDYGHGTMVAGIIHLIAPTAQILPLKAFRADGTGYNSDIIRAIYYAVQQNATVINMSFNLASYSQEVRNAIDVATSAGIVSVAAAGNAGTATPLYPASYPNVISVASTSNADTLSSFSSYGNTIWVGAPGEGVVTTYPYGTYAAAWGTSFSAPFRFRYSRAHARSANSVQSGTVCLGHWACRCG